MAWNRLYLKKWIKLRNGLDPDKEDGLLTDSDVHDAIEDAIKEVADYCNLLPIWKRFPVRISQWRYPMPADVLSMREVWFIDSNGTRYPLEYMSPEQFLGGRDPEDDTSETVLYYSYPTFQPQVFHFEALAPPIYDYVPVSYVTSKTIRTVTDSGMDFGRTLDGRRVEPNCVVHNITDDSYGYVEVLDTLTNRTTGTATSGTSTAILEDDTKDFTALDVQIGDIICGPSTGEPDYYAFVTEVGTTTLTYADFQDPNNDRRRFQVDDTYRVGKAQKIWLSVDPPHPGLRDGAQNYFDVGDAKATIIGTTFTDTSVTGSSTSGAEEGDTAIASGGSHAQITAVAANSLTVDMWLGGLPTAGETVTVRECDQYQVEGEFKTERTMWIGPTPSESDTVGTESIELLYNASPRIPQEDDDPIEVPEKYKEALKGCLEWKAAERMGAGPDETKKLEAYYKDTADLYTGDVWRPPLNRPLSPWTNRRRAVHRGVRDQTPSGVKWTLPV